MRGDQALVSAAKALTSRSRSDAVATATAALLTTQARQWATLYLDHFAFSNDNHAASQYADSGCREALLIAHAALGSKRRGR